MRKGLTLLLTLIGLGFAASCGSTRVVLIPTAVDVDGVPYTIVQLAEPVTAHVFVEQDGKVVKSTERVTISTGWWLIPPRPIGAKD